MHKSGIIAGFLRVGSRADLPEVQPTGPTPCLNEGRHWLALCIQIRDGRADLHLRFSEDLPRFLSIQWE